MAYPGYLSGKSLPNDTKITEELLRQHFTTNGKPGPANIANIVVKMLEDQAVITLGELRTAPDDTWKAISLPTIAEALRLSFVTSGVGGAKKSWVLEGLDPKTNFVCLRTETIMGLQTMVSAASWPAHSLVLFQAPPGTGKSATVDLLAFHLKDYHVIRIRLAMFDSALRKRKIDSDSDFAEKSCKTAALLRYINENMLLPDGTIIEGKSLWQVMNNQNVFPDPKKGLIIVFDEAQKIVGQTFADDLFNAIAKGDGPMKTFLKASFFFSSTGLGALVATDESNKSAYSSASENWHKKFGMSWFCWSEQEAMDFTADFNKSILRSEFTIEPEVARALHYKCAGHAGFFTAVIRGIHDLNKDFSEPFTAKEWLEFSRYNFYTITKSTRGAITIGEIMQTTSNATDFCVRLLHEYSIAMTEPGLDQKMISNLIHRVVIREQEGTYVFSSDVVATIALRDYAQHRHKTIVLKLPQKPLDFLTICLPLLDIEQIKKSKSITTNNGQVVHKESVWVSHLFATAVQLLPPYCVVDPQVTLTPSDHSASGQVDITVHNSVEYFLEFFISNFAKEDVPATIQSYTNKHTNRFTPTGIYQSIQAMPSAVINITANPTPPKIALPKDFFATFYNYMISDLNNPRLVWNDESGSHDIQLPFGQPKIYANGQLHDYKDTEMAQLLQYRLL